MITSKSNKDRTLPSITRTCMSPNKHSFGNPFHDRHLNYPVSYIYEFLNYPQCFEEILTTVKLEGWSQYFYD